jgi:hypothetical protein
MKLYRYFDQHWGQDLSVTEDEITGSSGFPESSITQFLSFLALFAGATAIWTKPPTVTWIALSLFFFLMSFSYAFGRRARIDRKSGDVTFSQSVFGFPLAQTSASLESLLRGDETGLIRTSPAIFARVTSGEHIPLFVGSSSGERDALESHWDTLTDRCPDLVNADE